MCTIRRKTYSRLVKRIRTKPHLVHHPSNHLAPQDHYYFGATAALQFCWPCSLSQSLLRQYPLLAKTHTAFALTHEVNIRLTILCSISWDPIVLSRQFRWSTYCGQVKKTCSGVSLSLRHSGYASSTSCHSYRDLLYNIHDPLTTVSDINSPVCISF